MAEIVMYIKDSLTYPWGTCMSCRKELIRKATDLILHQNSQNIFFNVVWKFLRVWHAKMIFIGSTLHFRILILPHWFSWFFTNYIFFLVKKATYLYCLYSFYTVTGDLFTFGIQSHPLNFECLESCTFKKCHIFVMLVQFL